MRIYLHLTPNTELVPFNYQEFLVGAFHRWLGPNEWHDDISLYSLSWLSPGRPVRGGLDFSGGATFHISAPDTSLLANLLEGVQRGHQIRWGMHVRELTIQRTPDFGRRRRFIAQSPILIKRRDEGPHYRYFYPSDVEANTYLTETLRHKLLKANLPTDVTVAFDPEYPSPQIKKITYRDIDIKATLCPVIVEGDPAAVAFAWDVGVGNSTGIGFGALR